MEKYLPYIVYPEPFVLLGFLFLMMLDFWLANERAHRSKKPTPSRRMRASADKGKSYFGMVCTYLILANVASLSSQSGGWQWIFGFSINAMILEFCRWEAISIFENMIGMNLTEAGEPNAFAVKFLIPAHNRLKLKFNNEYKHHEKD